MYNFNRLIKNVILLEKSIKQMNDKLLHQIFMIFTHKRVEKKVYSSFLFFFVTYQLVNHLLLYFSYTNKLLFTEGVFTKPISFM